MSNPFLIMYHGVLMPGRGIETLIKLTEKNTHVAAIILGNGINEYVNSLRNLAKDMKVERRVLFLPAVSLDELWKYVGAVDLSFMMIEGKVRSYYFALPNKFFESIQALTPIIASDFPEMKRLIDQYEIGLTCNPADLDEINECVEKMRTDTVFYNRCKVNLQKAKEDLCWEHEKQNMIKALNQYVSITNE